MKIKNISMTSILVILNLICYILFNNQTAFGAYYGAVFVGRKFIRLLTCQFTHYGIAHLLSNMLGLIWIGTLAENLIGNKYKFLGYYLLCGTAGATFSILINHNVIVAGASGAIYGLYGIMLGNFKGESKEALVLGIVMLIILGVIGGPNIDILGHIGGFIMGFLLGRGIAVKRKSSEV